MLGCFSTIGIGIGIVKGFSKYWYWVLLEASQCIGFGIGTVKGLSKYWYWVLLRTYHKIGVKKVVLLMSAIQ